MELLQADQAVKRPADKCKASFGMTVSLRGVDGREQSFRIAGEDEADPSLGTLSYVSPLARAVLTHGPERRLISPATEPSYWMCGRRAFRSQQIMVWCATTTENLTRTLMSRHAPRSDRARQGLWSGGSRAMEWGITGYGVGDHAHRMLAT
jgi:hypothetical protein